MNNDNSTIQNYIITQPDIDSRQFEANFLIYADEEVNVYLRKPTDVGADSEYKLVLDTDYTVTINTDGIVVTIMPATLMEIGDTLTLVQDIEPGRRSYFKYESQLSSDDLNAEFTRQEKIINQLDTRIEKRVIRYSDSVNNTESEVEIPRLSEDELWVGTLDNTITTVNREELAEEGAEKSKQYADISKSYSDSSKIYSVDSLNSALLAQAWADNPYDMPVKDGKYSAKHWATVAKEAMGYARQEEFVSPSQATDRKVFDVGWANMGNLTMSVYVNGIRQSSEDFEVDALNKRVTLNSSTKEEVIIVRNDIVGAGGIAFVDLSNVDSPAASFIDVLGDNNIAYKDGSNLDDNAIHEQNIIDNAVTTNKIKNSSISSEKIQSNAVTGDKIQSGTITFDKIIPNTVPKLNLDVIGLYDGLLNEGSNSVSAQPLISGGYPNSGLFTYHLSITMDLFIPVLNQANIIVRYYVNGEKIKEHDKIYNNSGTAITIDLSGTLSQINDMLQEHNIEFINNSSDSHVENLQAVLYYKLGLGY